jgi:hypothetical protein
MHLVAGQSAQRRRPDSGGTPRATLDPCRRVPLASPDMRVIPDLRTIQPWPAACRLARVVAAAALVVAALPGCSLNAFTVNSTAPVLKDGMVALDRESDIQFAREGAPANLITVETFLVTTPDNRQLLEILANGYSQYAFGFLEDDLEILGENGDPDKRQVLIDRATTFYDRSFAHALHLAELRSPGIRKALKGDLAALAEELKHFTRGDDGIGLFWMGLAMGSAINLHKDDVDRIGDLPRAIALLEHAHTIAPAYFLHGAALSLGVVYASQGKDMGGDPERGRRMFDEVITATGGRYLMAKALFARNYATVVQDRALFEKTLKDVLATPASVWPDQRLANEIARRKAARYLAQADDLFLPPEKPGSPNSAR